MPMGLGIGLQLPMETLTGGGGGLPNDLFELESGTGTFLLEATSGSIELES